MVLSITVVINPFVVTWLHRDHNVVLMLLALIPASPLLVFAGLAIWQERIGVTPRTFAAGPLSGAMCVVSGWVAGAAVLGSMVVLLGTVALPMTLILVAVAWVQPAEDRLFLTVGLAIAAGPFVVWFADRVSESPTEAAIPGAAVAAIVVALWFVRRRGRRTSNAASA